MYYKFVSMEVTVLSSCCQLKMWREYTKSNLMTGIANIRLVLAEVGRLL